MFRIDSNLSGVIRQTERLITRLPVVLQQELQPDKWRDEARQLALNTLNAIAQTNEAAYVGQFVATMQASVLAGGGLSLALKSPFGPGATLAAAQAAKAALDPAAGAGSLFLNPVQEFEALILDWVSTPEGQGGKRRDARDAGKTDQDIADLIAYIMLTPFAALGWKGQQARLKLTPHIEAFVKGQTAQGLPEATVDLWLRAVLAAWRNLIRFKYPERVRAALLAQKGDL